MLQLPTGQFSQLANCDPGAHGHEQVGAKQNEPGANDEKGSGHGMARASRQTKPAEQGRCRRTQPADDATGTGLEAKQQPADGRPRSKTTASSWPASRRAVQVGGGSAVVLALKRRAQTYPTYLSPSHLSPLPVTVHTHSLNLEKPI